MASPEQLVVAALQGAANPNHEIVQKAEAQLSEWEQQAGFFPILAKLSMKLASDIDAPSETLSDAVKVRWMAAVYLKNGIERYWRHNSRLELVPEQKQEIRDILLQHYSAEDVPQVALQVAVLLSKIARIDCWPELLPTLMKQLQACSVAGEAPATPLLAQQQHRTLIVLHYVIKALASRRIMAEKRAFEELAGQIFRYMAWDIWATLTTRFLQLVKTDTEAQAHSCLQRAYIAMRTLRKLVVYGCGSKPYKSTDHMNFIEQLFERLRQCLELRYELRMRSAGHQLITDLERFILKMMKTLNEFAERHSLSFARFVSVALEFSFHYVFHEGTALIFDAGERINFSNFVIQAINLLKGIMMSGNDSLAPHASDNTLEDELLASAAQTQSKFFSLERVTYLCEKIVTHYFLLTQDELAEWQQDPEGYGQDDGGGDAWKYELRPCVETLYFTCFTQHSSVMINEVLKFVRRAQQLQLSETSDLKAILLKDAIYNAVGQAAFHFFNKLDFGAWLTSQLLAELRIEAPNFRILRRRIIWLVGHWVGVQLPRELRPVAYEACLHLLRPEEDMPIRLAAARTLNLLIDDFEFMPEAFHPYFAALFEALFLLLREAAACDTKIVVLGTMTLLVEKMSEYIEPQALQLISYLPLLWRESELNEYNMLRCAIIGTLEQLVRTIRDVPEIMKPFLYSVIELSTDLQQRSHVYLIEDGIMLWLAVIGNSTTLTPELLALCDHLLPIIEMSSENLRTVLQLIHAYILLDPHAYLSRYGEGFVAYCVHSFEDIRAEGIIAMLRIFETCLKTDAAMGLRLVRPALPFVFQQVCLKQEYPMTMGWYLTLLARTLLIDQSVFMSVVQELPQTDALARILDVWIEMFPLVADTHAEKRKLFCLAFASIFGNNELLLARLPHILQLVEETLAEVMDKQYTASDEGADKATQRYYDSLVIHDEHELEDFQEQLYDDFHSKTYHDDRHRQLVLKDPVYKIPLTDYLKWQLQSLQTQLGAARYEQLMRGVCPEILEKINMYIEQTVPKACGVCAGTSDDQEQPPDSSSQKALDC
ncbi:importin-11 [Drosophila nasuta]|uniref:Importin-11 n=1 Tax=Drosophila albomicans TaxID=7291 RepID=A0A6P8WL39_DROAB|nr:importin-11 [Drosophila albomicans]XP_034104371.1 importin-11 [Drosophila albomicans]XP_060652950.1 importin-11 [Drosophila nasuta]XP_060652951.1 importin-11 [Drosophila nasuta]